MAEAVTRAYRAPFEALAASTDAGRLIGGVGAAVVIGNEEPGPSIITERDILHSNGVGQNIDTELVGTHLTSQVVFAAAEWSLEQAAAEMVRGGFRHVRG